MKYCFTKITPLNYEQAIARVTIELKKEGFGVLTEIDVQQTLKEKIQVDVPKYKILGACNPSFAHKALTAEPHIGTMLPCNVIARVRDDGQTEIGAINPLANMQVIGNPALDRVAAEVSKRLEAVIARI